MDDRYPEEAVLEGRSEQQGTSELEFGFLEIRERAVAVCQNAQLEVSNFSRF